MARGQAALEVKVGVFVFLLMALTVTVILLLGRTSQPFQEQVALKNVHAITHKLRDVIGRYSDPKLQEDVAGILSGARRLIDNIGSGRGLVHALIFDKTLAQGVKSVLARATSTVDRFGEAG